MGGKLFSLNLFFIESLIELFMSLNCVIFTITLEKKFYLF